MTFIENINPLIIVVILSGLLSIYCFLSLLITIKKLKLFATLRRLGVFLFFIIVTALTSFLIIGTQGYQALTKEELVATISVTPTSEQNYHARIEFPDRSQQVFSLKGDELLIDAYILKWKPWVNLLGLHTAYRLERVSGRYNNINDEKNKQRTVFAISNRAGQGVAQWREKYQLLSYLFDVEHGSASFVNAKVEEKFNLLVTNNGLIIRLIEVSENNQIE